MPLKISGQHEMNLQPHHWVRLARECRVDPDALLGTLRRFIADIPDAASDVMARCLASDLSHPIVAKLADAVAARCGGLRSAYGH
jgi:serine/threonine-protein kinase HipA